MTMRFSEVGVTREDQIHPVLFAKRQEFLLPFKRWIGQDESVCSDVLTGEENPFPAAGEDHVGVGHEHQRHHHIPAQVPHQSEDLVCGDDAFQRPEAGPLDHRHFGGGIGEEAHSSTRSAPLSTAARTAAVSRFGSPQAINGINAFL